MSEPFQYEGTELDLFCHAVNWKHYWAGRLAPFIRGDVIEVGAGLGHSTRHVCKGDISSWLCIDPDPVHAQALQSAIDSGDLPKVCNARCATLSDLSHEQTADTILYIDVLEHIEKDEQELQTAAMHLRRGGRLMVLSPAFNFLYSPFDKAIGHFRRYTKADNARLTVAGLTVEACFYLDSVGFFASLANRILLRSAAPSKAQIQFWDSALVPVSVYTDRLFAPAFGKTIVTVWQKT